MLQTIKCIRMGEVLLDENLHLLILCNNCHADLRNLKDFRQHLEKCDGLESLFQRGKIFKFNTEKSRQMFGKAIINEIKEFLIYDYNEVEVTSTSTENNYIDMISIEEELLNPKWYSDLSTETSSNTAAGKTSKQYDEIVMAVTPFVQFKENLKNVSSHKGKSCLIVSSPEQRPTSKAAKNSKCVQFDLDARKSPSKRKYSLVPTESATNSSTTVNKLNTIKFTHISKTYENKKRKTYQTVKPPETKQADNSETTKSSCSLFTPLNSTATTGVLPTNVVLKPMACTLSTMPIALAKREPIKEKQTAQILNKLQNLGLQIKRTQTLPTPAAISNSTTTSSKTDAKTLEILQKLQSKGMKVKILSKQQQPTEVSDLIGKTLPTGIVLNRLQKSITSVTSNPDATNAINYNLNKNLIIRKVN